MSSAVLITGATGFVGGYLVDAVLAQARPRVRLLVRDRARAHARWGDRVELVEHDLTAPELPAEVCRGIDAVFHVAGHAHAEDEGFGRSDDLHQRVTVEGTRRVLAAATAQGVGRFLFLSSVKAINESTGLSPDAGDHPEPGSAYGVAKREAEQLVLAAARPVGVVLRSSLVYGPEVKGNLRQMLAAIAGRRFPPIPAIDNRRSMIDVRDLVAALLLLETEPRAAGRVFIATDGEAYSTRRMYEAMSSALGRWVPPVAIPMGLLRFAGRLGDLAMMAARRPMPLTSERLLKMFSNAHYSNHALAALGFQPSHRLESTLPEMVEAWRSREA